MPRPRPDDAPRLPATARSEAATRALQAMEGWGKGMSMKDVQTFLEAPLFPATPGQWMQLNLMKLAMIIKNPNNDRSIRPTTQLQAIKMSMDLFADKMDEGAGGDLADTEFGNWDPVKLEIFGLFMTWFDGLDGPEKDETLARVRALIEGVDDAETETASGQMGDGMGDGGGGVERVDAGGTEDEADPTAPAPVEGRGRGQESSEGDGDGEGDSGAAEADPDVEDAGTDSGAA